MIRLTEEFRRGMSQAFHVILNLITKLVKLYLIIAPCQLDSEGIFKPLTVHSTIYFSMAQPRDEVLNMPQGTSHTGMLPVP